MTSTDKSLIKPCLINAVATGTRYSSLAKDVFILSFSVLLPETSCCLVINLELMALYVTASITDADSFVRECSPGFPWSSVRK